MNRGLKLADILVTIMIALVCGVIYILWDSLYVIVMPLGLHIEELIYGMWFIAGIIAALVIRKPGVALLAEMAASSGEFILGGSGGFSVLLIGFMQGIFAELVFMAFRYKRFDLPVVILASLASCLGSVIYGIFMYDMLALSTWNLTIQLVARFVGTIFSCALPAYGIVKLLDMTGVTSLVRTVKKEEYAQLED